MISKEKQHSKIKACLVLAGFLLLLGSCGQEEQVDVQPGSVRDAKQHTLKYSAGDNGSVDGVTHQTVEHGADGSEVTAVADTGYHFTSWSDGVAAASRTDRGISENSRSHCQFLFESIHPDIYSRRQRLHRQVPHRRLSIMVPMVSRSLRCHSKITISRPGVTE